MKKSLLILLLLGFTLFDITANAQAKYYYYKGQKMSLTIDKNYVNIIADDEFIKAESSSVAFQMFNIEQDRENQGLVKLKFKTTPTALEYSTFTNDLKQNKQIKHVFPFFERKDTEPIGTSDVFYLKLREQKDTTLLKEITKQQNVKILKQVPYMPLWYILSIQNSVFGNSVDATNYFYETGYFEDVDPAFMFNFKTNCTNDSQFSQLWGLKNTTSGIDIDACNAWTITRGAGINVAVVDNGIDPNHNDLKANFHSLSFDAKSGTSPSVYITGKNHGTYVAGIVAAVGNNNLQVVGVSPESKIMRISHEMATTYGISAELASGISWAWRNGADVINNSWGDKGGEIYNYMHSSILESAIIDAMTLGRGGKGSIVIFTSGNIEGKMNYPAIFHDDILVVGSISPNGARSYFSSYGTKLDVVAPGSDILTTAPNNSTRYSTGTSMAAPHVAGVAALVLSKNSNLTGQQVRNIIESTARKVGGYTYTSGYQNGRWNNEMGYGLVNAYAAVILASSSITGTSPICTAERYTLSNVPDIATAKWTVTPPDAFSIAASNATMATVTALKFNGQAGTLTATVGGYTVTKTIQACTVSISGASTVCNAETYTLGNNLQATSWTVTPSNAFRITASNATSATVTPTDFTGQSATLTAVIGAASVTKTIQSCAPNVVKYTPGLIQDFPQFIERVCGTSTFTVSGLPANTERVRWDFSGNVHSMPIIRPAFVSFALFPPSPPPSTNTVTVYNNMPDFPLNRPSTPRNYDPYGTIRAFIQVNGTEYPLNPQMVAIGSDPADFTHIVSSSGVLTLTSQVSSNMPVNQVFWTVENNNYYNRLLGRTVTLTGLSKGTYTVRMQFSDDCGYSAITTKQVTVSFAFDPGFPPPFIVFPIPATSTLNFELDPDAATNTNPAPLRQSKSVCYVRLVSATSGEIVFNQPVANFNNNFSIDVSGIPDGLYTLILQQGNDIVQQQTIRIGS